MTRKNTDAIATITKTMAVVIIVSLRDGQVTFSVSSRTSWKNLNGLVLAITYSVALLSPFCGAVYRKGAVSAAGPRFRYRYLRSSLITLAGVEGLPESNDSRYLATVSPAQKPKQRPSAPT